MNTNFTERFKREGNMQVGFWTFNKKLGAFAVAVLVAVMLINTGCTQNNLSDNSFDVNNNQELSKENVKVGNDGVNAAMAPDDDVAIVSNSKGQNEDANIENNDMNSSMVTLSVEDTGRNDPFLPYNEKVVVKAKPKFNYDLMPPPETIIVDTSAQEAISTKVSGIMYDRDNPSAIINIDGSDYLVRSGDSMNGYKVLAIAKDYVTVQKGVNIYKAGVGEIFSKNSINYNTVSNLENKFGGNKKK